MEARLGDRSLFPDLEPVAYLNHAGVSPPSRPVVEAAGAALGDFARRGSGAGRAALERRRSLKAGLGRLLGVPPEELGLTQNTGAGLTAVALGFPWRSGDRILGFRGEFPANVTPWQRAAELFGLELALLALDPFERSDEEGLAALEAELRRGARLVAVSAVQFQTGLAMPLRAMAELAHRHGAEICVDAVQALGVLPIDARALGLDYLSAGAHTWLMGLLGAGAPTWWSRAASPRWPWPAWGRRSTSCCRWGWTPSAITWGATWTGSRPSSPPWASAAPAPASRRAAPASSRCARRRAWRWPAWPGPCGPGAWRWPRPTAGSASRRTGPTAWGRCRRWWRRCAPPWAGAEAGRRRREVPPPRRDAVGCRRGPRGSWGRSTRR